MTARRPKFRTAIPQLASTADAAKAVRDYWDAAGAAVPIETRQRFLDALWAGNNVGQATVIAGMTFDQAMGVVAMNIDKINILRRETV